MKHGVIYCRVSSKEQIEGTSLESQELACREFARSKGIAIQRIFVGRGESAKFADRPELRPYECHVNGRCLLLTFAFRVKGSYAEPIARKRHRRRDHSRAVPFPPARQNYIHARFGELQTTGWG